MSDLAIFLLFADEWFDDDWHHNTRLLGIYRTRDEALDNAPHKVYDVKDNGPDNHEDGCHIEEWWV